MVQQIARTQNWLSSNDVGIVSVLYPVEVTDSHLMHEFM